MINFSNDLSRIKNRISLAIGKKRTNFSNSQFNQKCVMLRACAEATEASSEASPSSGGAGCFPVRRCSGPKTPLSMTVQRKLQRNYLVRTNA